MNDSTYQELSEQIFTNTPPEVKQSSLSSNLDLLSSQEFMLSIIVLSFGLLTLVICSWLFHKGILYKEKSNTLIIVILIITSTLFILSAGFSGEQTTPIIGLLGTIIGYTLGNKNSNNK